MEAKQKGSNASGAAAPTGEQRLRIVRFKTKIARPGTVEQGTEYANDAQGDHLVLESLPHPRIRWTRKRGTAEDAGTATKYVPVEGVLFYEAL